MLKKVVALILVLALLVPAASALAVTYYRVNTTWLKAHEKPQYDAKVVDSYRRDFAVTIERKGKDGWARVRFRPGGAQVYVQTKYLTACSSYTAYISKDNTVLHKGPATSFKSLGKLAKGTKVTVLTHGSAFDYVSTPRGKGYVRNTHLSSDKVAKTTCPPTRWPRRSQPGRRLISATTPARTWSCAKAPDPNTRRSAPTGWAQR